MRCSCAILCVCQLSLTLSPHLRPTAACGLDLLHLSMLNNTNISVVINCFHVYLCHEGSLVNSTRSRTKSYLFSGLWYRLYSAWNTDCISQVFAEQRNKRMNNGPEVLTTRVTPLTQFLGKFYFREHLWLSVFRRTFSAQDWE